MKKLIVSILLLSVYGLKSMEGSSRRERRGVEDRYNNSGQIVDDWKKVSSVFKRQEKDTTAKVGIATVFCINSPSSRKFHPYKSKM